MRRSIFVLAFLCAITVGIGCFGNPTVSRADPVLTQTVIITHSDNTFDVGYVYDNTPSTLGWAHITVYGLDVYVDVSGSADPGDIPSSTHTCSCDDGPHCHVVANGCLPGSTCSVSSPGVCYCSSTCS